MIYDWRKSFSNIFQLNLVLLAADARPMAERVSIFIIREMAIRIVFSLFGDLDSSNIHRTDFTVIKEKFLSNGTASAYFIRKANRPSHGRELSIEHFIRLPIFKVLRLSNTWIIMVEHWESVAIPSYRTSFVFSVRFLRAFTVWTSEHSGSFCFITSVF